MSIRNEETVSSEIQPDRLASALLIIGFILVSLFGSVGIIGLFAAGRIPSFILPIILLGGSGIFYGWLRTSRGSLATKQLYKTNQLRIRIGAMAGSATAFCVALVSQIDEVNGSWVIAFLVLSITWGLLLGIPFGGMGGLILASIWKNKNSAYIGGASAVAMVALWWYIFVLHLL
jgi:hypothetical protein